jgi:hypothetical protein
MGYIVTTVKCYIFVLDIKNDGVNYDCGGPEKHKNNFLKILSLSHALGLVCLNRGGHFIHRM